MKPAALIALAALGGLALAAASSGDGGDDRPDETDIPPDVTAGEMQATIRAMAQSLGFGTQWIAFFEAAALGESGFNTMVGRGIEKGAPPWAKINIAPGESAAAVRGWNRNKDKYAGCPWPAERYQFGSGGLWALLPTSGLAVFKNSPLVCLDPWSVFDPARAFIMIIGFCRGVMRHPRWKEVPTFGNIRVGMRALSKLSKPDELERQRHGKNKLGDRLAQLGYSRSLVDAEVPKMPSGFDPAAWLQVVEKIA